MDYDQIVFIGYVIDTAPQQLVPDGPQTYLGLPVAAEDVEARCQLMLGAMEKARSMLPPPSSPPARTLYVFVAPEFFFRGDTGAYEMDDVQLAIATLQSIAADAKWDNWIFSFGTIVGNWAVANPDKPIQICNFALVQQGGIVEQGADGARAIVKELKSDIDFIATDANPGGLLLGAVNPPAPAPVGPGSERQQAAYDGAGIFELRGINWVLEVCLDHLEGRLQQSPQLVGETEVQVQLVPSCGASVEEESVIAQQGGYIFNVDGYRTSAHANLFEVATPLVKLPRAMNGAVNITTVNLENVSPPKTVPVSSLYAHGSGSIAIYAPVPVPPARTVTGTTGVYTWRASDAPYWTFVFYVVYDDQGNFASALCEIRSGDIDFQGNKYDLPVVLDLNYPPSISDPLGWTGSINIELVTGGSYAHAIHGDIKVPGFNFQGDIMRFMTAENSPSKVETIWVQRE